MSLTAYAVSEPTLDIHVLDDRPRRRYDRPVKFLVVEGASAAREAIALALLPRGIKGLPVANRLAAWKALRADTAIQGAIVDVDDRAVEGVRLVEEIKADESTRGISVIVHTAQANKTFVVRMIETGAAGFLLGAFTPQTGPDRLDRALARLAGHDRQRRHIRVRPDPGEMVRVSFRLPGGNALLSGLVVDISLGGMAIELLNPSPDGAPGTGVRIPRLSISLTGRELAPAGTVVTSQGRTVAVRFEALGDEDRTALERYIYRRISA
jgi:CheY-like chemotaxis protein